VTHGVLWGIPAFMPKPNTALLEEKLKTGTDFAATWKYFMDHFAEDGAFLSAGTPVNDPLLPQILGAVVARLTGQRAALSQVFVIEVPACQLLHGAGFAAGRVVGFFYFKKLDLGMASFLENLNSDRVSFVRFSSVRLDTGSGSSALSLTE